ncbi:ketopantoate reductase family protein [Salinibaculum rarum]|uniref:ketopantoate reductase family protein n=1 Tax=Salinibaculum rarum TaxID=3058903 RepID=UPI00265FBDFA|nr:ketopantoate reductase family protein [Salinibaculum sp. KK48]
MDIVVVGAGSLGSLVGGLLARAHDVTLVGRDPHVSTVRESGLRISGAVETTVVPDATTTPPAAADLAVVTVKAGDTAEAAATLTDTSLDAALSLQNGMGNEATLADRLSCPVLAGTCTYGARLVDPGHVECTGVGDVVLGARAGGPSPVADRVGEVFSAADVQTTVATDMPRRLWEKLAVNAGINPTTALARVENGALVDGPAGETARAAAREVARVAQDAGIDLSESAAARAVTSVAETTTANTSSMHQDVLAGNPTEIDAINGYVVDRADRPVPVNETLTNLVRTWESRRDIR